MNVSGTEDLAVRLLNEERAARAIDQRDHDIEVRDLMQKIGWLKSSLKEQTSINAALTQQLDQSRMSECV